MSAPAPWRAPGPPRPPAPAAVVLGRVVSVVLLVLVAAWALGLLLGWTFWD